MLNYIIGYINHSYNWARRYRLSQSFIELLDTFLNNNNILILFSDLSIVLALIKILCVLCLVAFDNFY